jgi:carbonic anhydrase
VDRSGAPEFPESPDAALARLVEGNDRFRDGRARKPRQGTVRRMQVVEDQQPFAAILACADSRVSPEVVFDQGLGDLFVVRVAGNTAADPVVIGSLEFAVEVLGSVILMVLGHSDCGAVKSAIDVVADDLELPGDIDAVVAPILPVVTAAREGGDESLDAAIACNVKSVVATLSAVPIIRDRVTNGSLRIVGGEYQLASGAVELVSG